MDLQDRTKLTEIIHKHRKDDDVLWLCETLEYYLNKIDVFEKTIADQRNRIMELSILLKTSIFDGHG